METIITTDLEIEIYDDRSRGETFKISDVIFEDGDIIVATVISDWFDGNVTKIMINKVDSTVLHNELDSYYARNK